MRRSRASCTATPPSPRPSWRRPAPRMAGSSTAELRLRPTREDDLDYVVAAEADPDNAPFLAPSPREEHLGFLRDARQRHLIAEADGRAVGFALLRLHPDDRAV